jgi:hypothetical protein
MKTKLTLTLLLVAFTTITFAQVSPRTQTSFETDEVTIDIDYGAPSVKNRTIWGELVPYGKIWRAGANENTTISFTDDVVIDGKTVPAGKYGFFIIPNEADDWTIILSNKNDAWGTNKYNQENDLLRFNVTPSFGNENQEILTYSIDNDGINLAWEEVVLSIPVN